MTARAEFDRVLARPAPGSASGWLMAALGDLRLALPQHEIRLIALTDDLILSGSEVTSTIGVLERDSGPAWPAYGLDATLALVHDPSMAGRSCIFFQAGGTVLGLVCGRVWSLAADDELVSQEVPGCLRVLRSPVTGFARHRDGLVAVTSAADLASYLEFLTE